MTTDASPVSAKKVAAISLFERAGFALMPLRGKVPILKDWGSTPVGAYGVKDLMRGNWGIILGAEDVVIDIDPRNFKKGDKPISRLSKDLGIDLSSYGATIVSTGGGGLHYHFKKPAGLALVNDLKAYPGVEFKSTGKQVVGPGSVHPDSKKEYTYISGDPSERPMLPQCLLDLITKKEGVAEPAAAGGSEPLESDDAGARGRYASYLKEVAPLSVQGENGDRTAFKVAARGRDLGLSQGVTLELMCEHWNSRCQPAWDIGQLTEKVRNAYKYADGAPGADHPAAAFSALPMPPVSAPKDGELDWDLTAQGAVRKSFKNLINYLRSPEHGVYKVFGYNEFAGTVEVINPCPWHHGIMPAHKPVQDNDLKMLKAHLAFKCHFEATIGNIEEAVVVVANANRFHPIREYLQGLKWDGVSRINSWLHDYLHAADDDYTRAVGRKVLCAAVMRAFKPGIKFDYVMVLEGGQDCGKSSTCKILGGEWFADFTLDPHNKDSIQLLQGAWIIEMAEMDMTRKSDADAYKAFITRQVDTARLAYGRLVQSFPRQFVFIATKNPEVDGTYLKDATGGRRFWPIAVCGNGQQVDFSGLKAARNQLFAEAVVLAQKGERLDMETPELKTTAKHVAASRRAEHEWTERVTSWVHELPADGTKDFLTARDVFIDAMAGQDKQLDRRSFIAIAGIMKALGWKALVKREGARIVRGYQRPDPVLGDLA